MRWLGLATNLKRVPKFKIQRAMLDTQFRWVERQLALQEGARRLNTSERG